MENKNSHRLSLRSALLLIGLFVILISGSASTLLLYINHTKDQNEGNESYNITAIAQKCPAIECLKTVYLAELMGLSTDRPTNLYRFDAEEAKAKLLKNPLIKGGSVEKIKPATVYVVYQLRTPIAFLGGFSNIAIDPEGVLIPFKPFFTPKHLPEIFIETSEQPKWGQRLQGSQIDLVWHLLKYLNAFCCNERVQIRKIDVSKAYASSYGSRQAIIILEEQKSENGTIHLYPQVLRVTAENYPQELANYLALKKGVLDRRKSTNTAKAQETIVEPSIVIDLRASHLAYLWELPIGGGTK